jgi:hypothetical protein
MALGAVYCELPHVNSKERSIMSNTVRAWHFVGKTLRDGSPVPPDGVKLVYPGEIKPCVSGYHASLQPFDALQYAPGATLCLVECGGKIIHQDDKLVAEQRTIIYRVDATNLLRSYAKKRALSVIHLWTPPKVVVDYLNSDDESLRDAARGAAWGAARGAARGTAWDAAWDAARGTAWGAAWGAARDAAWGAARKQFNTLVEEQFKGI